MSEEKQVEQVNNQTEKETVNTEETKQAFDFKKEREERIKNRVEKAFFNELGVKSIDEIKNIFSKTLDYENQIKDLKKEIDKSKVSEYKLKVLQNGFDDKFSDYIVHTIKGQMEDTKEDFNTLLDKFKTDNSQFLKKVTDNSIKFNTSPNLESSNKSQDISQAFNNLVLKRLNKEK